MGVDHGRLYLTMSVTTNRRTLALCEAASDQDASTSPCGRLGPRAADEGRKHRKGRFWRNFGGTPRFSNNRNPPEVKVESRRNV
jgi:hypothetical protein